MTDVQALLARLDEIGQSLERSGHALALIAVGSVGLDTARLDEYSDLDFFAIVEDGWKAQYITDLGWLSGVCPLAYRFQNTVDGFKALFADGIFCEFAVFEQPELGGIPFAPGRIVWKRAEVDEGIRLPRTERLPGPPPGTDWQLGEALTNLYIGLCRLRRGEALSAQRFIQHYAVDRALILAALVEPPAAGSADPFAAERRFEKRFPQTAAHLPQFVQGYERSRQSALALLDWLEAHFEVNAAMAAAIREMAQI